MRLTCSHAPLSGSRMTKGPPLSPKHASAPSALAHIMLSVTGFTFPYFCRHVSRSIICTATCSGMPNFSDEK